MPYQGASVATSGIVFSLVMLVSVATLASEGSSKAPSASDKPSRDATGRRGAFPPDETAVVAVKTWLSANAIRLKTVEAGHGFADMQPLKKMIGDARIVSLGEATHGTREFFQLKHRMLEFLATEMGFTIFSIEANMPEAYRLNDYVLHGNGDPEKLIKGMYFWTWSTQEVLDMVVWMREFNRSGKGPVQFTGFDMQTPAVAAEIVREFVAGADPNYMASVLKAIPQPTTTRTRGSEWGSVMATFPVKAAVGKRVRFSGYIKTEGAGQAWLSWQVDGPSGVMDVRNRFVTGTSDWNRYTIEVPVAADAEKVQFGARIFGSGTAWFDGLAIELDGVPYLEQGAFDLDFESATSRGFNAAGSGFAAHLDSQVFHSGKQSLRMTRADDAISSSTWKEIVRHLEASREVYAKRGVASRDVEWGIQNARVVLQCLQMRKDEVMRDRSMADNVKWILDNNPGAKIVLWAHNGHVATARSDGAYAYEPMGASLRKMYGDKMVVFGFAFNRGSFQAVGTPVAPKPSEPGLPVFSVGPAPEGSLDAMLASTGLQVAAIDLHALPKEGEVAKWFSEPRATRNVGAAYVEKFAANFLRKQVTSKSYDALLFVEKTTAARPLSGSPAQK